MGLFWKLQDLSATRLKAPEPLPKWIFLGGIPVWITDSPSKLFKVAFDCFYFILCRDFFYKTQTIGIFKYWKELFQVLSLSTQSWRMLE